MPRPQRFGGTFAPPLTDDLLDQYGSLVASLPAKSEVRDALSSLLGCCRAWWAEPESTGGSRAHPSGRGLITDLDKDIQERLFDAIPWQAELEHYKVLLDGIDAVAQPVLRNAAFHLLWHAQELCLDREPMTSDKL